MGYDIGPNAYDIGAMGYDIGPNAYDIGAMGYDIVVLIENTCHRVVLLV